MVITAWFPALQCLSAFLVSCRCREKQKTHHTVPFPPVPITPSVCLLLKISFFSHHYIWLPINNSLNSVKTPFGEFILLKIGVWILLCTCIKTACVPCTHTSQKKCLGILKTHLKNNDKFVSLSRPGTKFLE